MFTGKLINVISLGIKQGENLNASDLASNGAILEDAGIQGSSLYFPAGVYEFDRLATWSGRTDVSIHGDGSSSKLVQKDGIRGQGIFYFNECTGVDVSDIQLCGTNYLGSVPASASSGEYAIGFYRCKNVSVVSCDISGFPTDKALFFRDCWCIKVNDSTLYWNVSQSQDGADIYVQEVGSTFESGITRYIEITNNRLLSNNLGGVLLTSANSGVVVSNNTVITCDENMVEIKTPGSINRKEGIELHYTASDADGDNRDVHEIICTSNIIKNTRWSGIYCNNATSGSSNPGGIKGTISANTIVNVCQETATGQASDKRAGVCIQQHQQLVVSDNVIRGIGPDAEDGQEHAGIMLECSTTQTAGIEAVAVVSSNVVTDVDGRGIVVGTTDATYLINANTVQNCTKRLLHVYSSCGGRLHITDNIFLNQIDGYAESQIVAIAGGKEGDVVFSGNLVSSEDKVLAAAAPILFQLSLSKATVSQNSFVGPSNETTGVRALNLQVGKTAGRHTELLVDDNYVANAQYGCYSSGTAPAIAGPTILTSTSWDNVTTKISSDSDDYIYEGERTFDGCITVRCDLDPNTGTWLKGDRRIVKNVSIGQPSYYVCTTGGDGLSSTWTGGPNL